MEYMTEASLTGSFIYGMFNNSGEMQAKILKALNSGTYLPTSYVEDQISQLSKSKMSPLIPEVLEAFQKGDIGLLYTDRIKMTKAIPYIAHKTSKGIKVSIFISTFSTMNKEGNALTIPMKTLYVLLESAYMDLYILTHPMRIQRSSGITRILTEVYTEMCMRILNRDYALTLDKNLHDQIAFLWAKFFLNRVVELKNPQIERSYAAACAPNLNAMDLDSINDYYDESAITTLETIINAIKNLVPRMNNLSTRFFVERYLNTYGQSSILALDYYPYMFLIMSNTILGSFIVNQPSISDIVKNTQGSSKFYSELSKLVL